MAPFQSSQSTAGAAASAPEVMAAVLSDPNQISKMSDWDLDIRQIEQGQMQTVAKVRQGRDVSILGFSFNRTIHQTGESPQGTVTLGIPSKNGLQSWRGQNIDRPSILGFGDGDELNAISSAGFSGFTVSLSKPSLVALADRMRLPLQDGLLGPHAISVHAVHKSTQLRNLLEHLTSPENEMTTLQEEDVMIGFLEAATGAEVFKDKSALRQRSIAVSKALNIMQDNLRDPLTVADICTMAGVSWRTLDRGFKEKFGIGPKAYLMRLKLSRVRSDLIAQGRDCKVTDIANDWGFWHMGQFAKDYARQFGNLPSEAIA